MKEPGNLLRTGLPRNSNQGLKPVAAENQDGKRLTDLLPWNDGAVFDAVEFPSLIRDPHSHNGIGNGGSANFTLKEIHAA